MRPLRAGWQIQSSCKLPEKGEVISSTQFVPHDWIAATVPTTVLAAQVAAGLVKDPYFGMNLRQIPGTTYPLGTIFSRQDMPADSPYACSWWYRTRFTLSKVERAQRVALHFAGITYRANIWINGHPIASSDQVAGTFRTYRFDLDPTLLAEDNVIAVEIFAPQHGDLAYNWVDWNPAPPDKDMGLWREVSLSFSGAAVIEHPQVISQVDTATLDSAQLTVTAEVRNLTDQTFRGTLAATMERLRLSQAVELAPHESKLLCFAPEQYPQLKLQHPKLWWPAQMGKPNLHTIEFTLESASAAVDRQSVRFGIRQVTSELTAQGYRLFKINGRNILIRGGGWAGDMLLRFDRKRLEDEFKLVRNLNLNTIRLEGKLDSEDLFNLADEQGILIMAGWCCCDIWERWNQWGPEQRSVAEASLRSQIYRLRNHASVYVFLNGSDMPPTAEVEKAYLGIEKELNWPNPTVSSASATPTAVSGPSGVKMTGPYDYVPPVYWETAMHHGGAFGYNTETSPGPAIPPARSLRRFLPADHLWPIDEYWNFHAGEGKFQQIDIFRDAFDHRYGPANSMEEFARKAQAANYEAQRAMFEAYSRNKYTSTGVIQWMLNNAWPSIIWHLYDYYLTPAGSYFGSKKALEPVHVQYSYDDGSIAVVNSTYELQENLRLTARVLDFDLSEKFRKETTVSVAPDGAMRVFRLPEIPGLSTTYFVQLELRNPAGTVLSRNFYWLSTKPEQMDFSKSTFFHSPMTAYADMTQLNSLPPVKLDISAHSKRRGSETVVHVNIRNRMKALAFLANFYLTQGDAGAEIAPALWTDNYISLLPGENRELEVSYAAADTGGKPVRLHVEGWNVEEATITPSAALTGLEASKRAAE